VKNELGLRNVGVFVRKNVGVFVRKNVFEPNLLPYKYPNISQTYFILHTYVPMKIDQTQCSESSAFKLQTPGNYPEESIQHTEHGESLKSRIILFFPSAEI
jgi:hypothetical protein